MTCKKLTVYTRSNCGYCDDLKRFLRADGIPFRTVKTTTMDTPTIVCGNKKIVGFSGSSSNKARIRKLIAKPKKAAKPKPARKQKPVGRKAPKKPIHRNGKKPKSGKSVNLSCRCACKPR